MLSGVAAASALIASTVAATAATTSSALIGSAVAATAASTSAVTLVPTEHAVVNNARASTPAKPQTKPRPQSATTIHNAIQAQGASNGT